MTNEREVEPLEMPDTDGAWTTTRFVDMADLRHDMHVNIVNFQPGGAIPFPETHVMEHGLYVLEGKAVYLLNTDWVEVEAGDFMWLRAFCPQACYAGGPGPFRYLLYKDVNRHARLDASRRGRDVTPVPSRVRGLRVGSRWHATPWTVRRPVVRMDNQQRGAAGLQRPAREVRWPRSW